MNTHLHFALLAEKSENVVTFETDRTNRCEKDVKWRLLTYEHLLICYNINRKYIILLNLIPKGISGTGNYEERFPSPGAQAQGKVN